MARRRWIRKPRRPTKDRYLTLVEAAIDGQIDDNGALTLGYLSRRMPKAVRARIESEGRQLALMP